MAGEPHVYTNNTMVNLAKWLIGQNKPGAFDPKDIAQGVTLGQLGNMAGGAIRAHPIKSLALGGSIAGNLGGLTDDKKFGGQLGGAALAGIAGNALGFNPAISALVGGNIGTLFDKLRAQKEAEQAQMQQYAQGRR